jgi:hypothetical protein
MPGLDRTGPEGKGPRTGRQMGKCNPDASPNEEFIGGAGRGRRFGGGGRGPGRGFGRRFRFRGGNSN